MKRIIALRVMACLLAFLFILAGCQPQTKETVAPGDDKVIDYPTNGIDLIIGYSPGGGYDTYARGLIPYLSEYLPDKPVITPINMEGAGGRAAAQYLYNQSPDGYKIGIWDATGMILGQAIYDVQYDMNEVTWIGRVSRDVHYLIVNPNGRYRSLEDLLEAKDIVASTTGISAMSGIVNILFWDSILGKNLTVIPHDGSSEVITSLLRGDCDVISLSISSAASLIEAGELKPVMQVTAEPFPFAGVPGDVPTAAQLGYHELAALTVERLIGGPPGMDPRVVKILSDALMAAHQDVELIKWSTDTNRPLDPLSAEETTILVKQMMEVIDRYTPDIKKYLEK